MLLCPVIRALRRCSARLLLALRNAGSRSSFLSPSRTLTPHSLASSARITRPSFPYSIPISFLPRLLASPLLATRHSSLATSFYLTLLKSHCSTNITDNPHRITLFHKHQGVPQPFFHHESSPIPNRSTPHNSNKKGHLCATTPITTPSANTNPPRTAAAACSNPPITPPSAPSTP